MRTSILISSICVVTWVAQATVPDHIVGEVLPTFSIADLTIGSPIVIVGDFVDPEPGKIPTRMKVTEGIRGQGIYQVGDTVEFSFDQVLYRIGPRYVRTSRAGVWDRVENLDVFRRGLLFLDQPRLGGNPKPLVLSGMRLETTAGGYYFPRQYWNPGPYMLKSPSEFVAGTEISQQRHRESGARGEWKSPVSNPKSLADEIKQARTAMRVVREVDALRSIPDSNVRLPKILEWIKIQEAHSKTHPVGSAWSGSLPALLPDFRTNGSCEQLWELKKSLKSSGYSCLAKEDISEALDEFFSHEARDMFRSLARNSNGAKKERLAALSMLADIWTVWGMRSANDPRLPTSIEQQKTIDELLELLKEADTDIRRQAASAILTWSDPGPGAEVLKARIELRAAPALVAYFSENPRMHVPRGQDDKIARIIGVDEWQRLKDRR